MIKVFKNFFVLSTISILIPFISFINSNTQYHYSYSFFTLFALFLFTIVLIYSTSILIYFFFKKISFKKINLTISVIFFIFFYIYTLFKDLLINITLHYSAEISLLASLIILILFIKNKYFKTFILTYIFIIFVFNLTIVVTNIIKTSSNSDIYKKVDMVNEEGIIYLKKNKKKNIYLVILDNAISIDKFDKYYNTNYFSQYKSKFEELDFKFIKNTNSAYMDTHHNFTSFFFMDYHINKNNYKNYSTFNLYPHILSNKYTEKMPLYSNLDKMNYKILWFDNSINDCAGYNVDYCSGNINKPFSENFTDNKKSINYSNINIINVFLNRSPILPIFNKSINLLGYAKPERLYDIRKNDVLNTFMKKMNNINFKNKGYFFLLHNLIPHDPYSFNSDCTLKENPLKEWGNIQISKGGDVMGYKDNYECMLKRVDEFVNFINKNDPDANLIIMSDHGTNIKDFFYLRFDTFALVKMGKKCKKKISSNLNFPNAARLLIKCSVGQTPDLVKKQSIYVTYEKGNIEIGGKFKFSEVDTSDDYSYLFK